MIVEKEKYGLMNGFKRHNKSVKLVEICNAGEHDPT
jgi:hypothetical protein